MSEERQIYIDDLCLQAMDLGYQFAQENNVDSKQGYREYTLFDAFDSYDRDIDGLVPASEVLLDSAGVRVDRGELLKDLHLAFDEGVARHASDAGATLDRPPQDR
jgi:hypothetical protein